MVLGLTSFILFKIDYKGRFFIQYYIINKMYFIYITLFLLCTLLLDKKNDIFYRKKYFFCFSILKTLTTRYTFRNAVTALLFL
jgi:hypothetical protein